MKELRIGLVLFGGVSLAVYMNGVVTELWHALRASQSRHGTGGGDLEGTAVVYRERNAATEDRPEPESGPD